ncbi:hypothetical protein pipiens_011157 [Culex pipiens pipiens]|uniref:Uncharacterized protein n=1 Tax=Culex pipiens pipiens TaxID=38569 RepID=A0ABD1D871_CULPP
MGDFENALPSGAIRRCRLPSRSFADTPTLCNCIRQLAYDPLMTTDKLQKMYFQSMIQVLLEIVASWSIWATRLVGKNLKKVLAEMLACGDLGEGNAEDDYGHH